MNSILIESFGIPYYARVLGVNQRLFTPQKTWFINTHLDDLTPILEVLFNLYFVFLDKKMLRSLP